MKKKVSLREAQDSYHALLIANGMQSAGADVISITCDHQGYYQVFCTHGDALTESQIDGEISNRIREKASYYEVS